jgi:hypothetical protein
LHFLVNQVGMIARKQSTSIVSFMLLLLTMPSILVIWLFFFISYITSQGGMIFRPKEGGIISLAYNTKYGHGKKSVMIFLYSYQVVIVFCLHAHKTAHKVAHEGKRVRYVTHLPTYIFSSSNVCHPHFICTCILFHRCSPGFTH